MVNGFNDDELEAHVQAEAYEPMDMTRCVMDTKPTMGALHVARTFLFSSHGVSIFHCRY